MRTLINSTGTARRILRSLRTLGLFSVRRAIDMKVLTDLKRGLLFGGCAESARRAIGFAVARLFSCCLKQDEQDYQDLQDLQDKSDLGSA